MICIFGCLPVFTYFPNVSEDDANLFCFACQGLIGLLVRLSSGSVVAFKTLYELNISNILKDILATFDLSHGVSSSHSIGGHCNQVHNLVYSSVLSSTVLRVTQFN